VILNCVRCSVSTNRSWGCAEVAYRPFRILMQAAEFVRGDETDRATENG
jgi:hypothetical protein